MGNCSLSANCNQVCGGLRKMKEMILLDDSFYKKPFILAKIIHIQAKYKSWSFRRKFKAKHSGELNVAFNPKLKPGKEIDLNKHPIILSEIIQEMEKKLGPFPLNEKEFYEESIRRNLRKCCFILPDNSTYVGYYNSKWQKEGYGALYTKDGCKYEGYFINDMKHGPGRYFHVDGYYYDGYTQFDKTNGFGKYVNLDGTMYVGNWKDERQHGQGEEVFLDGSQYEGNYENGKKHGKGRFTWLEGSVYEGDFYNGHLEGMGTYKWKDGRVFQGEWLQDKMHGKGSFTFPDGRKYIGDYKFDKKDGFGIFLWPDGRKFEGNWKNGQQHGLGVLTDIHGIKQYGEWSHGKKIRNIQNVDVDKVNEQTTSKQKELSNFINDKSVYLEDKDLTLKIL